MNKTLFDILNIVLFGQKRPTPHFLRDFSAVERRILKFYANPARRLVETYSPLIGTRTGRMSFSEPKMQRL